MDESGKQERKMTDQAAGSITRGEELAYELRIEEVMTKNIASFFPDQKMEEVLELLREQRISGSPVLSRENELIGIISIQDILIALRTSDLDAPVSKYMNTKLVTLQANEPVIEALKLFESSKVGRFPVLNHEGRLIGILTKGDISRGLLRALQKDYQAEEIRRYRARHLFEDIESDRSSLILRYNIKAKDYTRGGSASSNIKRALLRLGASPQIARRVGIAVYEAEINLIVHTTNGGTIRVEIEPDQISMDIYDDGPGIADTALAMKPGFSTATQEIREHGFGAGMGLANINRCVDVMKLESVLGKGTRLRLKIFLNLNVGEGYPATRKEPA